MTATDLTAQALGWALDEAKKLCFTEDFGVSVTWAPMPVRGEMQIGWLLLVTGRSPLLKEGAMFATAPGGFSVPDEAMIRAGVNEGIEALRKLRREKLGGANGRAKVHR